MSKTVANIAAYLDSHRRVEDFSLRAEALEFPPRQWELLSLVDGRRTAAQIGLRLELPAEVVWSHLCKLERMGLVVQNRIPCPWTETPAASEVTDETQAEVCMLFSPAEPRHTGSAPAGEPPVPVEKPAPALVPAVSIPVAVAREVAPVVQLQLGRAQRKVEPAAMPVPAPASASAPASSAAPSSVKAVGAVQLCLGRTRPASGAQQSTEGQGATAATLAARANPRPESAKAATQVPSVAASKPVEAAAAPGAGAWPIRPVLEAIRRKAGEDAMLSQLLAYRVFLRVPAQLLEESGIRSVSLIDPNLMITSPALREALAKSLQEVTGQGWPEAA